MPDRLGIMEALAKSDRLNLDINVNHSSPLYLLNISILDTEDVKSWTVDSYLMTLFNLLDYSKFEKYVAT